MNPNKAVQLGLTIAVFLVSMIYFISGCNRIDAGHVGIKVNMAGGEKGVSKTEFVTGWNFAEPFTTKVYEFPTFQQHCEYEPMEVPTKGGTMFTVHPMFNYNLQAGDVGDMFQHFRLPLNVLEQGYIKSAMLISLREVTNRFTVDSLLNNISTYDAAVSEEFNQKLHPYFLVTQFTSNMKPDKGLANIILKKAETLQNALTIENQQKAIKAQAANDIIEAERDAKVKVIGAQAEADKQKLLQLNLSPMLLQKMWIEAWEKGGSQVPTYMMGSNAQMFMQMPNKN